MFEITKKKNPISSIQTISFIFFLFFEIQQNKTNIYYEQEARSVVLQANIDYISFSIHIDVHLWQTQVSIIVDFL